MLHTRQRLGLAAAKVIGHSDVTPSIKLLETIVDGYLTGTASDKIMAGHCAVEMNLELSLHY